MELVQLTHLYMGFARNLAVILTYTDIWNDENPTWDFATYCDDIGFDLELEEGRAREYAEAARKAYIPFCTAALKERLAASAQGVVRRDTI